MLSLVLLQTYLGLAIVGFLGCAVLALFLHFDQGDPSFATWTARIALAFLIWPIAAPIALGAGVYLLVRLALGKEVDPR
ncbi:MULTISPECIES: hypothetical protein [Bacteria]|uniref:hypothetical protein n=1 Tax=Bacteria TaxID=2 RepID=UPI003C7D2BDD